MSSRITPPFFTRPTRVDSEAPRSIDDFFEQAHQSTSSFLKFRYFLALLSLGIANSGDATEISCMNYLLSYPPFQAEILRYNLATSGATLNATIFMGMLIGGLLAGLFGDKVGRKRCAVAGMALNSTSGIASAFAPNVQLLAFCRFFSGIGIGAIISSLIAYATEISPPSARGFYVTFVASFYTFGSITVSIFALILLGTHQGSWRIFLMGCAIPSMIGCIMILLFIPESPRFFASSGRYEEAVKSANWFADAMGFAGAELTIDEIKQHFSSLDEGQEIREGDPKKRFFRQESFRQGISNISALYGRGIRKNTIQLQFLWFCLSFGSGLGGWMNTLFTEVHIKNVYAVALLFALSNIPGNIVSAVLLDKVGRKPMLIWSMVLTSAALLAFSRAASQATVNSVLIIISACLFHCFLVSGWCTISCMAGETFPTRVRSTGLGICAASGRIATASVQYVNGALIDRPSLMLLVSSLVILLGALSPLFLRMEDMSRLPLSDRFPERSDTKTGEHDVSAAVGNLFPRVDAPFIAGAVAAEVV
mmetsp:Transcript_15831/g.22636  ORF Transcript_15831/g.22636 Transcript_15831/m.22636 type:complete len:537 (-) Transcript_15831:78-1688(-)